MRIELTVYGTPRPAGSKRGFVNRKTGGVIITDASKDSRSWKTEVTTAARQAHPDLAPRAGPLQVEFTFFVKRPKSHYGTGGNAQVIKESAPIRPVVRPDLLKLARAVEDALTGIFWDDDSQIVTELMEKHYGTPERVEIVVSDA